MWFDRLKGEPVSSPPREIEIGRYLTDASNLKLSGRLRHEGGVLVSDGASSFQFGSDTYAFVLPETSQQDDIEQFSRVIEALDKEYAEGQQLVSPLMPAAVIDEQSHLLPFEQKLAEVLAKGHLHHISLRPRLDLHYEDEVTDITRAKRLAKGALVHLASHSECWQRQTLSGVVPKKVLARFSEDDYSIYENCVYARLLDDAEQHLQIRIRGLRKLQTTLLDAQAFYHVMDRNHRLTTAICTLWGQTFSESETDSATRTLEDTLSTLERMRKSVTGLKQTGLYQYVRRNASVGNFLHMTNILSHDSHYRHLPTLWNLLRKVNQRTSVSPDERYQRNLNLASAYSRYAGLALRHALRPFMSGLDEAQWAGRTLRLKQQGLEWILAISTSVKGVRGEVELLKVTPWFGFTKPDLDVAVDQNLDQACEHIVAWPALDQVSESSSLEGNWIALSPFDLYCVERFGNLVERVLYRHILSHYGKPIKKVPTPVLDLCTTIPSRTLMAEPDSHLIVMRERLSDSDFHSLQDGLIKDNAVGCADELQLRQQELIALERCPVCSAEVNVQFQHPGGFRANCSHCSCDRYLRVGESIREFDQQLEGLVDFRKAGRRAFSLRWGSDSVHPA